MAETLPGFEVVGWYGLAAPAGTPKDVIARLNAETNRAAAIARSDRAVPQAEL